MARSLLLCPLACLFGEWDTYFFDNQKKPPDEWGNIHPAVSLKTIY